MSKITRTTTNKQILFFFLLFLSVSIAFLLFARGSANATNSALFAQSNTVMQKTINGISMEIKDAHQEGEFFQVDICYTLPDDRDWTIASRPDDALLKVADRTISLREEGILNYNFDKAGTLVSRCEYLLFPVKVEKDTLVSIAIKKIYATEPDQVNCVDLQKQLDAQNSGIVVQCPTEEHVGGFGVIQKPSKITNENAQDFAFDILTDAHKGPWNLSFVYSQP